MKGPIVGDPAFVREAWNLLALFEPKRTAIPPNLADKAKGVLLGLAVGNLLGLPVEGHSRNSIQGRFPNGVREIDPDEKGRPMDDDLAQAVDLGESLLDRDGRLSDVDWVRTFVQRLVRWRRVNGRGIGITTSAVIDLLENGTPPPEAGRIVYEANNRIAPNGGVMR